IVNRGVVPPLAWLAGRLLEPTLADGLIIAAVVPCTQASAAVWTRMAGGNDAIAVITTMSTSLACIVATPAWLGVLASHGGEAPRSSAEMAMRLALVVGAPILGGQLLRASGAIRLAATRRKRELSLYAQWGILAMVLAGAVESGRQIAQLEGGLAGLAGQIALMIVLTGAVHLAAWGIGFAAGGAAGLSRADRIGVAFAGSQKTLMVGLAIAIDFGGLAVLPMVAYHFEQLVLATWLAGRLRRQAAEAGAA
ncbi:MAG TPA: bile acid:sodium symporter, partial [Lacipirellulaceae bacterium]|nr:bile acid:sodium symporter [Lacipirellulaceae bacterium]